jgi:geranylgeranyl diphosphate synthase type II
MRLDCVSVLNSRSPPVPSFSLHWKVASTWVEEQRKLIDQQLDAALPSELVSPETLHKAMRYSVFAGGKRLRPLLVLASASAVGNRSSAAVLSAATAVEMLHTYSLIHDDLPALDNDDLRRGRPTCHKVFGEAMAILAGDALLTRAFAQLSIINPPQVAVALLRELTAAAGSPEGMVGGQVADLEAELTTATAETVSFVHRNKTAALIRAAVVMGAIAAGGAAAEIDALRTFGEEIGLAFQIVDDILDVTGSKKTLGKTAGKDAAQKKVTFPALFGMEQSRVRVNELTASALSRLAGLNDAAHLRELATLMVNRTS